MLMPTIVALLEATLLRAGSPSTQVCQKILTVIVEEKNMFAINMSYQKGLDHPPAILSVTTQPYIVDFTWLISIS